MEWSTGAVRDPSPHVYGTVTQEDFPSPYSEPNTAIGSMREARRAGR